MNSSIILIGNKKAQTRCKGFDVSVETGLTAWDTDERILSFLIESKQHIIKTLSTALNCCVKHSCGCFMVKGKAIRSTWSRFTPTEPNSTRKRAVINYGDIQHFLAGSLNTGSSLVFKKVNKIWQ
jgi:hypothetical protein